MLRPFRISPYNVLRSHEPRCSSLVIGTCLRSLHTSPITLSGRQKRGPRKRYEHLSTPEHGVLPLSPLLDPEVIAAKTRHTLPKPRQTSDDLTPFQQELAVNTFAQALATPIRHCQFSTARLPSHFLLPFAARFFAEETEQHGTKYTPIMALRTSKKQRGRASYITNTSAMIRRLKPQKTWQILVTRDIAEGFGLSSRNKEAWLWDYNMEAIVVQHLKDQVFAKLKWAFDTPNAELVHTVDRESSESDLPKSTWILVFREDYLRGEHDTSSAQAAEHALTSFCLPELLGQDMTKQLLQDTSFAAASRVVLVASPRTLAARLALDRLRAFIAASGDSDTPS